MEAAKLKKEAISFEDIKKQYPDEWVLIGNPEYRNPEINEAIVHKIVSGVLLLHSKDKREIGYKAKDVKEGFDRLACTIPIETAAGVLITYIFKIASLTVLGITRHDIEICSSLLHNP